MPSILKRADLEMMPGAYLEAADTDGRFSVPVFSSFYWDASGICAAFDAGILPVLGRLKTATPMPQGYEQLTSEYSRRMAEILILNSGKRKTFKLSVAMLHRYLDTPEGYRKDFRRLWLYVLDVAQRELAKKTGITFTWTPI